jgi:hypothetical protein
LGATRIRLASISHQQKSAPFFLFSKSLDTHSGYAPNDYQGSQGRSTQ